MREFNEVYQADDTTYVTLFKSRWLPSIKRVLKKMSYRKRRFMDLVILTAVSLSTAGCFTTIKSGPYGVQYTSLGGNMDAMLYGGTGPTGSAATMLDPKTGQPVTISSGQLYVAGVNNSESTKAITRAAVTAYGLYQVGSTIKTALGAGVEKAAINATTQQADITAGTEAAKIAADVDKAKIAAEVATAAAP